MTDTLNATDVSSAARKLGISKRAVRKRISRGKLRAKKIGGSYVIPRSEVRRAETKDDQ
jgi:excisionase family DNA binding protein